MENFQIQSQMQQHTNQGRSFGPPTQPYLPPKNHKKTALIVILCVAAVFLAAILGGWFYYVNSASYKIEKGFLNLMRETEAMKNPLLEKLGADQIRRMFVEEGAHLNTKMNVTTDTFLGQATLGIDTDCEVDRKRKEMAASASLSMRNYELVGIEFYGDEDQLRFSIPNLYLEDVYIENENVLDQYNRSMWSDVFGEAEGDDFSIDLFPDPWIFGDEKGVGSAFFREYAVEIAECRRHMTMEKAGQDLYRVSFDEMYFNELIRQVLYDYVDFSVMGREDIMGILSYFDIVSGADEISFILEIDRANRIESIRMEEPLSLCDGRIRLDGDIYFLGEKSSIEKMQGRLTVKSDRQDEKKETEIIWQTMQSLELDNYQMEADVKCGFAENGIKWDMRFGGELECDGRKNCFDGKFSVKDVTDDFEIVWHAAGDFSHIKKGESFDMALDELTLSAEGEEVWLVRGEAGLSPLKRRVRQNVKAKTEFFKLSEREWDQIFDKVYKKYENILESLYNVYW